MLIGHHNLNAVREVVEIVAKFDRRESGKVGADIHSYLHFPCGTPVPAAFPHSGENIIHRFEVVLKLLPVAIVVQIPEVRIGESCCHTYRSRKKETDRKSTRLNSSHVASSYAV